MGRYRGEGGHVFDLDEPLPPAFADQVRRGALVEVDNRPGRSPVVAVAQPARTDTKGAWVDYAVANGAPRAVAEAMTRAELIDGHG